MSSTDPTDIQFRVQPGVISAIYFILFDLVLLAILDVVLARIVCSLHYRRIAAGEALEVKSVDIPGLTTFLVGRRTAFPNALALFVKVAILACILVVDINIDSSVITPRTSFQRSGTFFFDPSDAQRYKPRAKNVTMRWERTQQCRETDALQGNITYYSIAFNLLDDPISLDDGYTYDWWEVDDSSIVCLKEGDVDPSSVSISAKVIGCSQHFGNTSCTTGTRVFKNYDLQALLDDFNFSISSIDLGLGGNPFAYQFWELSWPDIDFLFKEYHQPNFTCFKTAIGPTSREFRFFYGCLLVEYKDRMTLVEHWRYRDDIKALWRDFPGPLFEGDINIGPHATRKYLEAFFQIRNWESLSGVIVADSSHYKEHSAPFEITQLDDSHIVTRVSPYAIALAVLLVLLAILSRIVVAFTIGKDRRPQVNSINGLSSIAREESEPTGYSYVSGRGATIGLAHRDGHRIHFGPLKSREGSVRMETGSTLREFELS